MSEERNIRINKVLRELNISLERAIDHLKEKGISIEHLANISNVDRNYISDIEKGKRNVSIEIIEKIIVELSGAPS